jgi:hypothetical protein
MENDIKLNPQELQIQRLLARYLTSNTSNTAETGHIDDDSLSAFVEGTLNERESAPVVSHLVDCWFCRHTTARLETAGEPSRISEVLSGIFSKIFGTTDATVFAHEEQEKKEKKETDETE